MSSINSWSSLYPIIYKYILQETPNLLFSLTRRKAIDDLTHKYPSQKSCNYETNHIWSPNNGARKNVLYDDIEFVFNYNISGLKQDIKEQDDVNDVS